ncbi:MAG: type I-E CRISPR-associated protein Cas7/Cse4/CasC [Candidatus Omnitrophica bacterium]|nr:type I-E CRISPR-associated protein Cas7/Cse4/CasC [Candidatus Omnitrophota bacterium]
MSEQKNKYSNVKIEFHVLQAFPVTCLNRDDVGAPKTAVVGGTTRARVSSQCWKRSVRLAMRKFSTVCGSRTKYISDLIANACKEKGATDEQAKACGDMIEKIFIKKTDSKVKKNKKTSDDTKENGDDVFDEIQSSDKTDTLLFLSPKEVSIVAEEFKKSNFKIAIGIKNLEKLIGTANSAIDALDIALFGRMVAQAATLNVEAAASFSHAISTHKVTNEVEFFTALDDCAKEQGSSHMGSLEFNSATYYRYVSLDLGQLSQTLVGTNIPEAVESFLKALYLAVPSARQTTQSGYSRWDFARIYIRKGQRLQVPFETAVKAQNGGFLAVSKEAMCEYLNKKEKLDGSLFGKIKGFDFGDDENFNIDDLIVSIKTAIA